MLVLYHVDKTLYLYTVKPCYLEHHATRKNIYFLKDSRYRGKIIEIIVCWNFQLTLTYQWYSRNYS